jgi:hypothetical protein
MSAGTAYSKRYAGGFADLPSQTTAIDQQFLNAVEAALLQLIGQAPSADGQVMQWDFANTRYGPALLLNKNIDAAAAIAKSKLDFSGGNGIVNADVAGAAAISRSKLDFGAGLVNADISTSAAIAISKLALGLAPVTTLPGSPTDGQLAVLTDSTSSPTYAWLFTWSATASKWIFIGGSDAYLMVATSQSLTSASTSDLATDGPSITVPRAGDYMVRWGAQFSTASGAAYTSVALLCKNGTPISNESLGERVDGGSSSSSQIGSNSKTSRVTGLAASDVLKIRYQSDGTHSTNFSERFISVTPVAVT